MNRHHATTDTLERLRALAAKADRIGGSTQRRVIEVLSRALLTEDDRSMVREIRTAPTPDPADDLKRAPR